MFTTDPAEALALAHQRFCELRRERAAHQLRPRRQARCVLAASLRSAADRLDRASLAPRPA